MRPIGFDAGPPPERPPAVTRAFVLMLTRAALSVVGLVVTVASRDSLRDRVEAQQRRQEQRLRRPSVLDVDQVVDVALVVGVVVGVLFLVFYVVLAFQVRRGRQWARVVTWVLAAFGVLGLLTHFVVSGTVLTHVVSTVSGLLDLAVIILLALRPTNAFVAAATRRRRSH